MNGGVNAFGSGNRANATIGRAIRLVLLNVGGALAAAISTNAPSAIPASTPTPSPRTRRRARGRPIMSRKGFSPGGNRRCS